ncbi:MAG TPA: ABC transporter ATP-binding protein [bacterium]|nr:ABC transporter ATP-binding protein [bacterium]
MGGRVLRDRGLLARTDRPMYNGAVAELRRLSAFLRPYTVQLTAGVSAAILVAVAWLYVPRYLGEQADRVIQTGSLAILNHAALIVLAIYAFRSMCLYIQLSLLAFVGHRLVADLRAQIFHRVQRWSLARFAAWHSGEVISRTIQDTQLVEQRLLGGIVDLITTAMTLTGIIVMVFLINWRLAVLTFVALPAFVVAARVFAREVHTISTRAQQQVASLTGLIKESVIGARVIRAFVQESREERRFGRVNERTFQANYGIRRIIAVEVSLVSLLTALALVLVLWAGARYVARHEMTPGSLLAFLGYLALSMDPAMSLTRLYSEARQAMAGLERVYELLDVPETVRNAPGAVPLPRAQGRVRFAGVSLAYEPGRFALHDVTLDVQPGEHVAIVGPSGAGKTSLVNLIPRFYDPTDGTVEIDGYDLRRVTIASVRAQIGLVPQDTILFAGTIAENIAYGRPHASRREVENAARVANAHGFIAALPRGYDQVLGEGGLQLSGGQRQRLALARAVLNDPAIYILDEATSALDTESEEAIQEAMARLTERRTTFIVAHRLSTVRSADRIVVMLDGRIAEIGRHDELTSRDGPYSRLVRSQLLEEAPVPAAAGPAPPPAS